MNSTLQPTLLVFKILSQITTRETEHYTNTLHYDRSKQHRLTKNSILPYEHNFKSLLPQMRHQLLSSSP